MEIVVEGLRFERDRRRVLDIPHLTFANGSTTALFGPNGSGKTTLLRLIAGLDRPSSGRVRVGDPVTPAEPSFRGRIAYSFQEAVFLRGTVRANLDLALDLRAVPIAERDARIREVAAECGIAHLMDRSARKLSGGEAQRVNVARALSLRAPVTLLDEPLAGLDRVARAQLLDDLPRLLGRFASTTVIVTHDREEAFRIADQLVVLVDGVVRAAGAKGDVYRAPPNAETAELLGYSVIPVDGVLHAVPPGALRVSAGAAAFEVVASRVIDMGNHRHVIGTVGGARVDVRLRASDTAPSIGARIGVTADALVRLPTPSKQPE